MQKNLIVIILALALSLCCITAIAEHTPITQPPAPPPETSAPAEAAGDNAQANWYPFPIQVQDYTFVSFSWDPSYWDLSAQELVTAIMCRYFEEVYPGCRLEQLRDFVFVPTVASNENLLFARAAGSDTNYHFLAQSFAHPLVSNASFTVLVSISYPCAFFSDAPWMAASLEAFENSPVSYDDALALAQQVYAAHFSENGLPEPDRAELASLRVSGSYEFSHNEGLREWYFSFFRTQSPYEHELDWASCVFEIDIRAETGEVIYEEWFPVTVYDHFLELVGQQ